MQAWSPLHVQNSLKALRVPSHADYLVAPHKIAPALSMRYGSTHTPRARQLGTAQNVSSDGTQLRYAAPLPNVKYFCSVAHVEFQNARALIEDTRRAEFS